MNTESVRGGSPADRPYTAGYRFHPGLLHPRHWPLWLLLALLFAIGRLPFSWVVALGRWTGRRLLQLGGKRRAIAWRNLELCFPEKTLEERQQLLKRNFEFLGVALLEPGVAWFSSRKRILRISRVLGLSNLLQAGGELRGVLINSLHMLCAEMALRVIGEHFSFNILYRVHDNPVYEYVSAVGRARARYKSRFIPRKQVRDLLYFLERNEIGLILPDQDFGGRHSRWIPFFGVEAATITSTSDFARLSDAAVVMGTCYLDADNRYVVQVSEPLEQFPTDDSEADTARVSALTEAFIRQHPDQYLWQHRRFKRRPRGQKSLYDAAASRKG
ncbi:MAG: lipid A biosynthesis lauroyl acyltransferase [Kistimonas sp.]|nr:lipid A biosynthesis lauroyl acyltransferase [Kistimonas sp.]